MNLYRRRRIEAHVDMTPMIDTLLQLFMIFLFGATFISASVNLELPQAPVYQKAPQTMPQEIVVSINANRILSLNNRPVSKSKLRVELQALLASTSKPVVTLIADRHLPYEEIILVLAEVHATGATSVRLGYDPKGE